MKTFDELTPEEQQAAETYHLSELLKGILNGAMCFSDERNGDGLQRAINEAIKKAGDMQTPWFAGEYVMEARYSPGEGHVKGDDGLWSVGETLRGMASVAAQDARYLEPSEPAPVRLPEVSHA